MILNEPQQQADYKRLVLSCLLLTIVSVTVFHYPIAPLGLAGFLVCYGYLLNRHPDAWLFCIPALLPIMDFTPWTGRFFFDEFDLVVLTTVALQLWQRPKKNTIALFSRITVVLFYLYSFFYLISLLRGLLPLQPVDANSFSNYYSNFNSLRVGKGVIEGAMLLPALIRVLQNNSKAKAILSYGVIAGLTGVIAVSILERFLFTGVFDFSSEYRINALFSTMHTGGGHIESYLMLGLPFIVVLFFTDSVPIISRVLGGVLFVTGLYVLLVTFSRGGYIGFAVGFMVLIVCLMVRIKGTMMHHSKQIVMVFLAALIIPVLAIPVFQGQLIKHRFNIFSEDKIIRTNHWLDAIRMMDDTMTVHLLGMGVGSYPRTYFWLNTEKVIPASYKIGTEANNQYLQLRGGDALFMGQSLRVIPHTHYRLQVNVRSQVDKAALSIAVCEKSLIYSLRCSNALLPIKLMPNITDWQFIDYPIDTGEVAEKSANIAAGLLSRPVQLTLANGNGAGKVIDVDNIKLMDEHGKNQLANGDFSKGLDRWFFATEKHHPWHILNLWVHVLFDQGLIGLILLLLLLLSCIYQLYKKVTYDPFAPLCLSALCAFSVVGWVDSPFDAPRITLLFFLIVVCSLANIPQASNNILKNRTGI